MSELPRVLVYNKIDRLDEAEQRALLRRDPDAVLVSATTRETTRALVARLAEELAARWDAAARPPPSTADLGEVPEDSEERPTVHADTLDALMDLRGKRAH